MIECPNCGSDNMVNAIFCRQCQKKLNLDEINPEDFDDDDDKGKGGAIVRLITVIIVTLLAVVIGLMVIPAKIPGSGEDLDDDAKTKATRKFSAIQSAHPGVSITFTNDEASHAAAEALGLPRTGEAKMLPTKIGVAFLEGGDVKVVLQQKAFGKIPFCTTVVVTPSVPSTGTMDFKVKKASIGLLPCFGPLQPKAVELISSLLDGDSQFSAARIQAASLDISDDKGTYVFPTE